MFGVAVGLSVLVGNSAVAYLINRTPAIIDGPIFVVLSIVCIVYWGLYVVARRHDRRWRAERAERVKNYRDALWYARHRAERGQASDSRWPSVD